MSDSEVMHLGRPDYISTISDLKERGYLMCVDLTAVDYVNHPGRKLPDGFIAERFEVVAGLLSLEDRSRIRIRVQVPEDDPSIDTLFYLYPGTEAMEREVFDLFGINFNGHPDMTRILLPEDWEGHPLRKDYSVGAVPVQFKAVNGAE